MNAVAPNLTLVQTIYRATDGRLFPCRFFSALSTTAERKGILAASMTATAAVIGSICCLAISYFTLEGSIRSLIEVHECTSDSLSCIKPIGDAGGWIAVAIFSVLALRTFFIQSVRQAEIAKAERICQGWLRENPIDLVQIEESLKAINQQSLFPRSIAEIHRITSRLIGDDELQGVLQTISEELSSVSKIQCIRRAPRNICSVILGTAVPVILLGTAGMSAIGEFGLGKILFFNRKDLEDTGHFGEWILNAVEASGVALFLLRGAINEGYLLIARDIYARHIPADGPLRIRINLIANEELAHIAGSCLFNKAPGDY